jgi:hypothetical protein
MSDLFDLPFEEEPPEPEPNTPLPASREASPAKATPPARRILSVTELTVRVRDLL